MKIGSRSPWQKYLQTWRSTSNEKNTIQLGLSFLEHGADPRLVERWFSAELYECAKKKRKETMLERLNSVFKSKRNSINIH
jgi:hypothetical protein